MFKLAQEKIEALRLDALSMVVKQQQLIGKRLELIQSKYKDSPVKQAMSLRQNIRHFKNEPPPKEKIEQILRDAHDLVPVKNNLYRYNIDVWGPQHATQKRKAMLMSITDRELYRQHFDQANPDDLQGLEQLWQKDQLTTKMLFNEQLLAPYLLVYYHVPNLPTEHQKKGYQEFWKMFQREKDPNDTQWVMAASMHAYGATLLCAEQGLYASFCKCYYDNPLAEVLWPKRTNIAFMLGIGYRNWDSGYYNETPMPLWDEIVHWK